MKHDQTQAPTTSRDSSAGQDAADPARSERQSALRTVSYAEGVQMLAPDRAASRRPAPANTIPVIIEANTSETDVKATTAISHGSKQGRLFNVVFNLANLCETGDAKRFPDAAKSDVGPAKSLLHDYLSVGGGEIDGGGTVTARLKVGPGFGYPSLQAAASNNGMLCLARAGRALFNAVSANGGSAANGWKPDKPLDILFRFTMDNPKGDLKARDHRNLVGTDLGMLKPKFNSCLEYIIGAFYGRMGAPSAMVHSSQSYAQSGRTPKAIDGRPMTRAENLDFLVNAAWYDAKNDYGDHSYIRKKLALNAKFESLAPKNATADWQDRVGELVQEMGEQLKANLNLDFIKGAENQDFKATFEASWRKAIDTEIAAAIAQIGRKVDRLKKARRPPQRQPDPRRLSAGEMSNAEGLIHD